MGRGTHEETIRAPVDAVWPFLTDPGALSAWFGADAWLELEPGGEVRFRFADGIERRGTVTQVEPGRCLTWRWRELHGAGLSLVVGEPSLVSIELLPHGDHTVVRIRELPVPAAAPASEVG